MKKIWLLLATAALSVPSFGQVVHPTPQKMVSDGIKIGIGKGFVIDAAKGADADALALLNGSVNVAKGGVKVKVGKLSDKSMASVVKGVELPSVSGAYYLNVTPKEVVIAGYDDRGIFYGVETFRQLISGDSLYIAQISDYPDIMFRGSVEGFYGNPWSHRDRLSQLEFYGKNKLNTYIYGPKDDPYHSSLSNHGDTTNPSTASWRDPYPEAEGKNIAELAATAKRNKVDFVWAIHPGQDIKWNDEDYGKLIGKFNQMYDLGVRSFAVFFDDISGEGTNPVKQADLLNRINKEFVKVKGDVTPLIMCPTEYNKSWANPKPDGYLSILGDKLDKDIQIMWTGDRVCDNITMETLNWINVRIKRPTYIWWNFPVTDYVRHLLVQGPSYGLDTKATSSDMSGFVSNPMEHAEASKLALYGVADYSWNTSSYDYIKSWERAFGAILPEASSAYRSFAIHSADFEQNGHGFRRDESWETKVIDPIGYNQAEFDVLKAEFVKIGTLKDAILKSGGNKYLLSEMEPWLVEFDKLGNRGVKTMDLIETNKGGDVLAIWSGLVDLEMSPEQTAAYNKHKSGTLVLQPFISKSQDVIRENLYINLSGQQIKRAKPFTSFANKETLNKMIDGDGKTFFYSWSAQGVGDYVGVDMGEVIDVNHVVVEQGRKDKDRDYFQSAVLEYSADSLTWAPLKEVGDSVYSIVYKGTPVAARWLRFRALDGTKRSNWTAIRTFDVNPKQKSAVGFSNVDRLAGVNLESVGNVVSAKPILEVISLPVGGYFGVELPVASAVESVKAVLASSGTKNPKGVEVEYSIDGQVWSGVASGAVKFVRIFNTSSKAVDVKLSKFDIVLASSGDGDLFAAFDKDLSIGFVPKGDVKVAVPNGAKVAYVLSVSKDKKGIFKSIEVEGLNEIVVGGDDEIREIIFK